MSVTAAATERCRFWPKTAARDVKRVRAHCHGAGSSRHPAIFPVKIAWHEPMEIPQSSAISHTVSLLLLRTIVLTSAIISLFLDVDSRLERGVAFNGGSTLFKSTEPVKHSCTTHCISTVCLLQ